MLDLLFFILIVTAPSILIIVGVCNFEWISRFTFYTLFGLFFPGMRSEYKAINKEFRKEPASTRFDKWVHETHKDLCCRNFDGHDWDLPSYADGDRKCKRCNKIYK